MQWVVRLVEVLLNSIRCTYLDTHIQEDGQSTEGKVAVLQSTLDEAEVNGSLFGFVNLGEEYNDESDSKDSEGNPQSGSCVSNLGFRSIGNERTHQNVAGNSSRAVEHTTNLNELVALVAATAEKVQHGVDNAVQDTHCQTSDESTEQVNAEYDADVGAVACIDETAAPLNQDAYDTDSKTDESGLLVAELGNQHTSGNTHHEVSDEVTDVANLSKCITDFALVLDDCCHRSTEVRHEGNHCEECNHHDNCTPLF